MMNQEFARFLLEKYGTGPQEPGGQFAGMYGNIPEGGNGMAQSSVYSDKGPQSTPGNRKPQSIVSGNMAPQYTPTDSRETLGNMEGVNLAQAGGNGQPQSDTYGNQAPIGSMEEVKAMLMSQGIDPEKATKEEIAALFQSMPQEAQGGGKQPTVDQAMKPGLLGQNPYEMDKRLKDTYDR